MIEIHIDTEDLDVIRMSGFPDGYNDDQNIYEELLGVLWELDRSKPIVRYLMGIGLYITNRFNTQWRVVAVNRQDQEVGRLECLIPGIPL